MNLLTDREIIDIRDDLFARNKRSDRSFARAIEQAIFAKLKEQGYVVVPREPTRKMSMAAASAYLDVHGYGDAWIKNCYSAMIEAGEVSLTSNTVLNEEHK